MLIPVLLFVLGFPLLTKGGDWFVDGSVGIANRFHLPELLIGATIVSIGTTLPEVMVSAQAAIQGNAGISYGNAIGSIICNTSLIAALTAAIRPEETKRKNFFLPVVAFFLAAFIYVFFAWTVNRFERWNGCLFLGLFVAYICFSIVYMRKNAETDIVEYERQEENMNRSFGIDLFLLAVGMVAIAFGARLLVNNGALLARLLGVPDSVIGLTLVALGTSLPELITAIISLIKGHSSLALGNVIGANFFNIALVSGTAITISPFAIPKKEITGGINASLAIELPLMLFVMAVLCIPALYKEKLSRWQGILLLIFYCTFCMVQGLAFR